jgi:nicotinamide-nucleotide amidase
MYPFDEIRIIRDRLIAKGETVAVAESVTSGHLQAALSLAEDARAFYQGGITAYNLGQKSRHLLIEPIHAQECDCVSERIAEQMALGAARLFTSTYGLSITGYAAKVPEKGILEPFAFFSIARNGKVLLTRRLQTPAKERMENVLEAARTALSSSGASPATLDALWVQLWFARPVLEAMVMVLTLEMPQTL